MPVNVRNFWFDAYVDGRATTLSSGPQGKEGGLSVTFSQRDHGRVRSVLTVRGEVAADGRLVLSVFGPNGDRITVETER